MLEEGSLAGPEQSHVLDDELGQVRPPGKKREEAILIQVCRWRAADPLRQLPPIKLEGSSVLVARWPGATCRTPTAGPGP